MIPLRRGAFGALSLVLLGACAAPSVRAQDAPAPVAAPEVQTRFFTIYNVKASLAAFWLDPAHQPVPVDIQEGQRFNPSGAWATGYSSFLHPLPFPISGTANPYSNALATAAPAPPTPLRLPGNALGPADLKLPHGIERIVAIDAQNSLRVTGTESGVSALKKLLSTLDVPLAQIEIEARFYQLDRATLRQTGVKFDPIRDETPDTFGSVAALPPDFETRIGNLVRAKRALLLAAPRTTLIDGLGAEAQSQLTIVGGLDEPATVLHPVATPALTLPRIAEIHSSTGIRVSVTRMEGGLMAIAVEPHLGARVLFVQATIREDQSLAIQMSPSKDKRQIIVIVTPRRVRRAGDDT